MSGKGAGTPTQERPPPRGRTAAAIARGNAVADRGKEWVAQQDPASRRGATIGLVRRYQAADGQLYAVLISIYLLITLVPAAVVLTTLIDGDPTALADRAVARLHLDGSTASLIHDVLAGAAENERGAALLAVANLAIFGVGFGRVLQLVHARSWGIDLRKNLLTDNTRYLGVLLGLFGLILLGVVQSSLLAGQPGWIAWALVPLWFAAVVGLFVWIPWTLLHHRIPMRDLVPGAVVIALAIVGLRLLSSFLLVRWLVWYSGYYGGFGVVMALFFWLAIASTAFVVAAALSPALAERRDLRVLRRAGR